MRFDLIRRYAAVSNKLYEIEMEIKLNFYEPICHLVLEFFGTLGVSCVKFLVAILQLGPVLHDLFF